MGEPSPDAALNPAGLSQLVEEFIAFQINMGIYVRNSGQAVRSDFRGFFRYLTDRGVPLTVHAFGPRFVGDYFAFRRERVAGSTIKRWIKSFNAFAKWAVQRGYIEQNPMENIRVGWVPSRRREFMLDVEGARRFLTTPIRTRLAPQVDRVLRNLLVFGGLRQNEILRRRWHDVNLEQNVLLIYDTKNTRRKGHPDNLDRVVPLVAPLANALKELQEEARPNGDDPIVFLRTGHHLSKDAFYVYFHSVREALGLGDEFVPHSMRHSLASNLIALGATVADVALLLGHSSLRYDGRRTATEGYITSSLSRVRSFLDRYAEILNGANQSDGLFEFRRANSAQSTSSCGQILPVGRDAIRTERNTHLRGHVVDNAYGQACSHTWEGVEQWIGHRIHPKVVAVQSSTPSPEVLAEAVALWKSLFPGRPLTDPEFHQFLYALMEQVR